MVTYFLDTEHLHSQDNTIFLDILQLQVAQ